MPDEPVKTTPGRLASLDGLRGIAALAVVGHHLLLSSPRIADAGELPVVGSVRWWIEFSPLKLFTAGPEAVLLFFVLSGLVLVLPVIRRPDFDWIGYFPRRALRLGLPVVASIVFAAVLILAHPQVLGASVSSWIGQASVPQLSLDLFVRSLDILAPANILNNPLWTLRWELIFSLALPIYVYLAVRFHRQWVLGGVVSFVLVALGYYTSAGYLQYLPFFYAGAVVAVHIDSIRAWARERQGSALANAAWAGLLAFGLMLLIAPRLVSAFTSGKPELAAVVSGLTLFGAVLVVAVGFLWRPAVSVLTVAPSRWLGRVSFSLYLVHVPILIAVANVVGPGTADWLVTVGVTLVLSLVAAELFYRFVEMPAHRLSKRVGARASGILRVEGLPARAPDPARQD